MNDGNVFQTAIIGGFIALMVLGFIFFAVFKNQTDPSEVVGNVAIWGTVPKTTMNAVLEELDNLLPKGYSGSITYTEFEEESFIDELVDALAASEGPDLVILDHEDMVEQRNKIFLVGWENFSERKYKDTYIEGTEIFLDQTGILAFPFTIDPLVMYWNRDILSRESISAVPEYWDEFFGISPKITKQDQTANIQTATIAFGEYANVTNAKAIVSALILQAGDPIVRYNPSAQKLQATLGDQNAVDGTKPAESAMRFYTEFSNPVKAVYSWNRALPDSKRAFLSGDLAFYIGFASELEELRRANPNLNFDLAPLPQIRDDATPSTYAHMEGVALLKSTQNTLGAFRVQKLLASNPIASLLEEELRLPPVTRQLLKTPPGDDVMPIFYDAAVIGEAWLEPKKNSADTIFKDMVESISSGRLSIQQAISEAKSELAFLLP